MLQALENDEKQTQEKVKKPRHSRQRKGTWIKIGKNKVTKVT